ncbi:MAG: aldehyde ferredoxin oxidoreductase [Firmicutes bacterium]|nr:aldehyde ferredoxin oxidoreductase [Bacillota bacterium]
MLVISSAGARLEDAEDLRGLGTIRAARVLAERYGEKAAISLIGPAGEHLLPAAGIAGTDQEGFPGRYSGRGGLGAVMASKGLKAVVVLAETARPLTAVDKTLWDEALKEYNRLLQTLPATSERMPLYGTAATLEFTNRIGALPTRNFSRGQYERAEAIGGMRLREIILERGGEGTPTHACMPGCLVRCSNRYADKMGRLLVSPMEYETHALMGSNLEIGDFDQLAELTLLCNDLGLDTIETGAAIGVAMEGGLLPFGDFAGARRLIEEIGQGTVLGRLLGHGAAVAGRVLGVRRIPAVKGQAMPAYDPRGMKGNGVVYATSPMGADHTAGNMVAVQTDHLDPEGKVELSRQLQIQAALFDTLGLCNFVGAVWGASPETIAQLVGGLTGQRVTVDELKDLGLEIIKTELEFNRRAGFTAVDDRVPEFMREEPLPPHNSVWDVPDTELDGILK